MRTGRPLAALVLAAACGFSYAAETADGQWPAGKARQWYEQVSPVLGCNYLPRTAVNSTEMWQAETFDPKTIDQELGWAESLGYNSVRVFLQYVVWDADSRAFEKRLEAFLAMAAKHGIRVMPVFFCDCSFAGKEPYLGKQDDPVPGVHNSGWVPSPGLKRVTDRAAWPRLEAYVRSIVGAFRKDERILVWDLYNEPGNSSMGRRSLPLAEAAFRWARAAGATQPLTIGAWTDMEGAMSRRLMELSDVVSFHGYDPPAGVEKKIRICKRYGRPVFCTEWLHRQSGNTMAAILPILAKHRIAPYNWGLVAGRTQTYFHWGSRKGSPPPKIWQHDIFHADGTPYDPAEVDLLRSFGLELRHDGRKTSSIWIRDPFVVSVKAAGQTGPLYYMTGTSGFKGFHAWWSADLERWKGPVKIFEAPGGFWATRDFWAPEIHRYRGRWYLLASFKSEKRRRGTQILVADSATGPFVPHSKGPVTPPDWECLDGTLYVDREGKPWMVFCHEWVQIKDGTICSVKLTEDLKAAAGKPILLFKASQAPWTPPFHPSGTYVTDGPFLHRTRDGTLLMLWSSFRGGKYALGVARSSTGKITGPWVHEAKPLFSDDGGHGMLFRTREAKLVLVLHAPNGGGRERARFFEVREEGCKLSLAGKLRIK